MHVQLDLSNGTAQVANTTTEARLGLKMTARVYSLDNRLLLSKDAVMNAGADAITAAFPLDLAPLMGDGVVLVRLELPSANGQRVSDNFYWRAAHDAGYRALTGLPEAAVTATAGRVGGEAIRVHLRNVGPVAALAGKLTLLHADGTQVLSAYYSDDYVSLLPGEDRLITISLPEEERSRGMQITMSGWNMKPISSDLRE